MAITAPLIVAKEVGKAAVKEAGKAAIKATEVTSKSLERVSALEANELARATLRVLEPNMDVIRTQSLEAIKQYNLEQAKALVQETSAPKFKELTLEEKAQIIKEVGWSKEIVDCIKSMEQYEIYKNAELHEAVVNGRKCLIKDIDMEYVDPKTGETNRELMADGKSPIDPKTGEKIELHHMGQSYDSPFAELCANSEHGGIYDKVLHDKTTDSWRQDPEKKNHYNNVQRPDYWKTRALEA